MSRVRVGVTVITTRRARIRPTRRATSGGAGSSLGSVVTGYLAWGAWVSAADRHWLYQTQAWWRVWLRPGYVPGLLVFVGLWLAALLFYWYPRRLTPQVVGITTVVAMVLIGGVLTSASLATCRAGRDAGRRGRLGARYVCGQPALLSPGRLPAAPAAGLPGRRPGLPGGDADRGPHRGGGPVAPADRPDAGPAGPGRDHPHRAGQHVDPRAAAARADLPARKHRRDRARRQPPAAG